LGLLLPGQSGLVVIFVPCLFVLNGQDAIQGWTVSVPKLALGIVVYNPPVSLLARVELALSAGWELFIYDNSPLDGKTRDYCAEHTNAHYLTAGKNVGLGYAMSAVTAQAYYVGHAALLFFDQDTGFTLDTLAFVTRFYEANASMSNAYSSVVFNAKDIEQGRNAVEFLIRDVLLSINSGSLYFLENVKRLNWFDESFFVDCVDYEFCLRSSNAQLKIAACTNAPGYDHVSEQADMSYFVFGRSRRLRKYSRSRVTKTTSSMLRLCWRSFIAFNGRYLWCFVRSLAIYILWQLVVRILAIFTYLARKESPDSGLMV
jgi:rhamnosyltransferase